MPTTPQALAHAAQQAVASNPAATATVLASGASVPVLHHPSHTPAAYLQVTADTVAHQLAHINRWAGAPARAYSLAEHSLLMEEIVTRNRGITCPRMRLAALTHHALATVLGDTPYSLRVALRHTQHGDGLWSDLDRIEQHHHRHMALALGLRHELRARAACTVLAADEIATRTAWRDLMPAHAPLPEELQAGNVRPAAWISLHTPERAAMPATAWAQIWLHTYEGLLEACLELDLTEAAQPGPQAA
jgi:hypothetical protein